jgi:uncharacterized protein
MNPERVVIDTNVLISATLVPGATPFQVVAWVLEHHRLLFSEQTFEELRTRLYRPKFDRYLSLDDRKLLLHDFNAAADWVALDEVSSFSRDRDDDKFVQTALNGGARWLVSGDADLLCLGLVQSVQIMTPAKALSVLMAPRDRP